MSNNTNMTYLLCILLIALSSSRTLAFTAGSQCLNSNTVTINRVSSTEKSLAASESFPVTTLSHPMDYSDHHHHYHTATVATATPRENVLSRIIPSQVTNLFQFDKSKAASMGVSFAMTYNFISNINGSITLSTAWYIASIRSGLSPLVAGNWKSLMSAYGSLYLLVTILRPLRFAMALSLTKHTERLIEETQHRLGCARPVAIGVDVAMGLAVWVGAMAGGVMSASALSGVPVF